MELSNHVDNVLQEQQMYESYNSSDMVFQQENSKKFFSSEFLETILTAPFCSISLSDAREKVIDNESIDTIITSPPYWKKRDYKLKKQIGQEDSIREYVKTLTEIMDNWQSILKVSGSVFLNVGDSFVDGRRMQIPNQIAVEAEKKGWILRDQIIWVKPNSTPHSAQRRLPVREEFILHFTKSRNYYYDIQGYKEKFDNVTNVWIIKPAYHQGEHLAPFPEELVERILLLACPKYVCTKCGSPFVRKLEKTAELDESRPQAKRAKAIFERSNLTSEHIAAIQAVGISDAGKALRFQTGAGRNNERIIELAREAKNILGGYFREFTFAKKRTIGWQGCNCKAILVPGLAYDPFIGTGTTLRVAAQLGLSVVGSDLRIYEDLQQSFQL